MQYRTFTVPFSEVVGDGHPEIEFGPDDLMVVRPIYAYPIAEIRDITGRMAKVADLSEAEAQALLVDLLALTVKDWRLATPDGAIPMPTTPEMFDALPGALRSSLLPFLLTFRGRGPDPTPAA